jgi:hypothetical protein
MANLVVLLPTLSSPLSCANTLHSLLTTASSPSSLTVSLLDSPNVQEKQVSCVSAYAKLHGALPDNVVSTTSVASVFNKGTENSLALAIRAGLAPTTEFVLAVDDSSTFVDGWDTTLAEQWASLNDPNGVISYATTTTTTAATTTADDSSTVEAHQLCGVGFVGRNIPQFLQAPPLPPSTTPLLSNGLSLSFLYGTKQAFIDVPFDPFNHNVPDCASDVAYYARLFTRGYDVYVPPTAVVASKLARDGERKQQPPPDAAAPGMRRMKTLLQLGEGDGRAGRATMGLYGLGKRRSFDQLQAFVGADLPKHAATKTSESICGSLKKVQYDASVPATATAEEYSCSSAFAVEGCAVDPAPVYPLLNPPKHFEPPVKKPSAAAVPTAAEPKSKLKPAPNPNDDGSGLHHPKANHKYKTFNPGAPKINIQSRNKNATHYLMLIIILLLVVFFVISVYQCVRELGKNRRVTEDRMKALRNPTANWGRGIGRDAKQEV